MADYKYFISKLKAQELMRKQTRYEKKIAESDKESSSFKTVCVKK